MAHRNDGPSAGIAVARLISMKKFLLFFLLAFCLPAHAQPVQQLSPVTPGHAAMWTGNGVLGDAGVAAAGNLTSLGVTAQGPGICQNSDVVTAAGWNSLCLSVSTASPAQIVL